MGDTTIEWCDKTWNPTRGCSRVSEGCRNCYAERVAARFAGKGQPYEGLAVQRPGSKWTGEVRLVPGRLADPLGWRKPHRVFVNSMSDLFHEKLSNEDIGAVFAVMAAAHRQTFQVLTKRPERMRAWFAWAEAYRTSYSGGPAEALADSSYGRVEVNEDFDTAIANFIGGWSRWRDMPDDGNPLDGTVRRWPLPNVWLGVSVENQATADERIPLLLETPAAVRFVSYEPALGPVDFTRLAMVAPVPPHGPGVWLDALRGHVIGPDDMLDTRLDWVIAGSESGPRARPAELDWFRSVRDQCAAAGVAFFLKQWTGPTGAGIEPSYATNGRDKTFSLPILDGSQHAEWPR